MPAAASASTFAVQGTGRSFGVELKSENRSFMNEKVVHGGGGGMAVGRSRALPRSQGREDQDKQLPAQAAEAIQMIQLFPYPTGIGASRSVREMTLVLLPSRRR
jgi:hypothetical protein